MIRKLIRFLLRLNPKPNYEELLKKANEEIEALKHQLDVSKGIKCDWPTEHKIHACSGVLPFKKVEECLKKGPYINFWNPESEITGETTFTDKYDEIYNGIINSLGFSSYHPKTDTWNGIFYGADSGYIYRLDKKMTPSELQKLVAVSVNDPNVPSLKIPISWGHKWYGDFDYKFTWDDLDSVWPHKQMVEKPE